MKIIMLKNVKMPTIIGILTFISMINTSESLKARSLVFNILVFYDQMKFHAQLSSMKKSFMTFGPGHA